MTMDPELAEWLDQIRPIAPRLDITAPDPVAAAQAMRQQTPIRASEPDPALLVSDHTVPGETAAVPVRLYRPAGIENPAIIMNFHGGGWVLGSVESDDASCRALALNSGCAVVSVDYRLAPEHPFPAASDDCLAATLWFREYGASLGLDPSRMAVSGSSAGGNLAASVALRLRDAGRDFLRFQMLIYPVCDHRIDTQSFKENAHHFPLLASEMAWFWDQYTPASALRSNPYASVSDAKDHSRLPPAHVLLAELDVLRDEGLAYAEKLQAAGVPVTTETIPGMVHGFLSVAPAHSRSISVRRRIGLMLAEVLR